VTEEEAMSELRAAAASYRRIKLREAAAHERLVEAMRAASAAGIKQVRLVETTGYTREHVRRLLKT
jgi:biopolymer transport protein ExbD